MGPEEVSHAAPLACRHVHPVELAQILRCHGQTYLRAHPPSPEQRKVIRDVTNCRTEILGGHLETCGNGCGYERVSFHSCRNRHCPKCQSLQKVRWLLERSQKLLPTPYFHVVVTLPHEINPLILQNRGRLYNLLFESASEALIELAKGWNRLGALPGFTAILHTWTQELTFHAHLHLVVTAGGLSLEGDRWIPARNSFLVPVRGKFLDGLRKAFEQGKLSFSGRIADWTDPVVFKRWVRKLRRTKWVVYAKAPFGEPRHVFSYLGHYTHRVAISNQRLLAFDGQTVTFRARDNQNPGTHRLVRLAAQEFIRRFLLHVLPHGFVRICHFGLMASRNAHTKLKKPAASFKLPRPHTRHLPPKCIRGTGRNFFSSSPASILPTVQTVVATWSEHPFRDPCASGPLPPSRYNPWTLPDPIQTSTKPTILTSHFRPYPEAIAHMRSKIDLPIAFAPTSQSSPSIQAVPSPPSPTSTLTTIVLCSPLLY